ncbi:hypothetical protein AB5N19_07729 [Seiridium cardinale]|uniref:Uncharacterized protein n=1 Tax=Seiridium cardinale TaxID=138064 RepID=A0ABR2X905_9PEZI
MRRWTLGKTAGLARHVKSRHLSTLLSGPGNVERISVRCGSAGSVFVDLHNIAKVTSTDPLLIYLPPYSSISAETVPQVPSFLRRYPTAVINYRWNGYHPFEDVEPPPVVEEESEESGLPLTQRWPVPIHDTLQAYSWIIENLTPSTYTRRDVYVYGSYLGASLATSLALTESHPHQRMAVRGCVAFNGIYNWTMFLPDHQINKQATTRAANVLEEILGQPTDPTFQDFKDHLSCMFGEPAQLFDPFVSACLFFQTAGLLVPQKFDASADPVISMLGSVAAATDEAQEAIKALLQMMVDRPPRRSALAFPPRKSTLKIPETLLLHSAPPPLPTTFQKRRRKAITTNHFKTQAEELGSLMRRSLEKLELRDRSKWDDDFDGYLEVDRRVQVYDVGKENQLFDIPNYGEVLAREWLEDRMSK